jgi:hypothetical protein
MVQGVLSDDPVQQREMTIKFRKLLSKGNRADPFGRALCVCLCVGGCARMRGTCSVLTLGWTEREPPIAAVISCGVVPRFVEFLGSPDTNLQVRRQ